MNNYILGLIIVLLIVIIVYHYWQSRSMLMRRKSYKPIPKPTVVQPRFESNISNTAPNSLMNNIDFIPSNYFEGRKKGFVFKTGKYGLGYYYDNFYLK